MPKPSAISNPCFFTKEQIRVGTKLICLGRLDPGRVWSVSAIETYDAKEGRSKPVSRVVHLADLLTIRSKGLTNRTITFAYISYSAIWWLASGRLHASNDAQD